MSPGVRLPPPRMVRSTKVAISILGGILLAGLAMPWFPSPAGWILLVVVVYVGIPLALLIVNDLSELRQARMLVRNLEVFPPTQDDAIGWLDVKCAPLAEEHVLRWRRWFPWLLALVAITLAGVLAGVPLTVALAPAVIGVIREVFLAANVIEWMVPENWPSLGPAERLRLRLCLLLMCVTTGIIAAGVIGIVYYLFFVSDEPIKWNLFAFAATYGLLAWPCGRASLKFGRQALRKLPPEARQAERPV